MSPRPADLWYYVRTHRRRSLKYAALVVIVAVGVGLLAAALGLFSTSVSLTPFVLAVGPVLGGVLIRAVVLRTPAQPPLETA